MTPASPTSPSAPRYAFFDGEWHRIATQPRIIPGYSTTTPGVTGCGLRLTGEYETRDYPDARRCGCAGKPPDVPPGLTEDDMGPGGFDLERYTREMP